MTEPDKNWGIATGNGLLILGVLLSLPIALEVSGSKGWSTLSALCTLAGIVSLYWTGKARDRRAAIRIAEAEARTAVAEEATARLKVEAAKLRVELEQIRAATENRSVPADAWTKMAPAFQGVEVSLTVVAHGDFEIMQFAQALVEALTSAGAQVATVFGGIVTGGALASGVTIWGPPSAPRNALELALTSAGIEFNAGGLSSMPGVVIGGNELHITVGAKPGLQPAHQSPSSHHISGATGGTSGSPWGYSAQVDT